ncbi:MAG: hypothetical protein CMJ05_08520 [Pelagibacterales bacterium]|nr:hypothetical protein [Pelagibacterales bacterium]|tara:strand:- start:13065 stop:14669 length:1605 start_codon:yes stop_codon:yes gene_type:complete
MNQKKLILYISISLSFFLKSCNTVYNNSDDLSLTLNYSNKELNRLYYGNKYYQINGITDILNTTILKKPNSVLLLEKENSFIDNYQQISLVNKKIKFFLHDLIELDAVPVSIKFNDYINNNFYFTPTFSVDNLELLKNRSSKIYTLSSDILLTPYFIDELNYDDNDILLKEIVIYEKSLENIKNLEDIGLYPISFESIKFVHNPLSNLYSIYPDLRYFSNQKSTIFNKILRNIKINSKSTIYDITDFEILNDTIIKEDLNLNNVNFKIKEGVTLSLLNNASVFINNSIVNFEGSENNQIQIEGLGTNSIKFTDCDKININYVNFKSLSNLNRDSLKLTASITAYNSNIKIMNSNFENNIKGDDFINFYNSNFEVKSTKFRNIIADAIDSDFSNGTIENSSFIDIGNDAIDFSASNSKVYQNIFINIGDKSLSAGENSKVIVKNSVFKDSELALVVKDGSELISESNNFHNNSLDYCAFIKKTFYRQPILRIKDYKGEKYLFQNGVTIQSNYKSFDRVVDVESLLYGNIYGRASN